MLYILSALYVILSCSGLVLFKFGSKAGGMSIGISSGAFNMKLSLISVCGLLCYLVSFLLYMFLVSKFDLSKIYPITTGIIFIGVMLMSILFLNETVHWQQLLGSALILIGVIILAFFSK